MVSDMRTSSLKSTDADHSRRISAPLCLITSSGSMELPSDLCIALPSPSSTQPLSAQERYGDEPFSPTPTSSELWNQPRYWSPPSRYTSAGQGRPKRWLSTARWLEPESNHTSRMSLSLLNSEPPHLPHFTPAGSSSAALRSYQTSAECSRKSATMPSRILRSVRGSRQASQ